jgi:hypothetical protein
VESYVLVPPRGHTKGSNPAEGTVVGIEVWPLLVGVLIGWYSGLVASPLDPLVVSLPLCPIFQLYLLSRSRIRPTPISPISPDVQLSPVVAILPPNIRPSQSGWLC